MAIENFEMYAGDTKRLEVTVKDNDENIVVITDMPEIRWQLSKGPNRPPLVEKFLGDGVQIISGPAGRFDVTLDSVDTETLRQGAYYHEAEVIDVDGGVATVLSGAVTILPTLIKPETSP